VYVRRERMFLNSKYPVIRDINREDSNVASEKREAKSLNISKSVEASQDGVELGITEETATILLKQLCKLLHIVHC
jgi:hypothetical protein